MKSLTENVAAIVFLEAHFSRRISAFEAVCVPGTLVVEALDGGCGGCGGWMGSNSSRVDCSEQNAESNKAGGGELHDDEMVEGFDWV